MMGFFYVQDVRYDAGAWMRRSVVFVPHLCCSKYDTGMRKRGWLQDVGQKIAPAFSALPPFMAVV